MRTATNKTIKTKSDFFEFCKEYGFVNHVQIEETDLTSFSEETIEEESRCLLNYAQSKDNYVAEYYGCGLFSRILSVVKQKKYSINKSLFVEFGYSEKDAAILTDTFWC